MPTILNSKTEEDEDCKIIDWVTKRVENDFSAFKEHEIAEPWETYKKQWDGLNPTLLSKNEFLKCCSMPACIHRPSEENLADECPKCDPRIYKERSCEYTQRMWQLEACQVRKACSATGCSNSAPQIHIQVTQEVLQFLFY
ncbi:uncharacterized protein LOC133530882 [Cydia pomonella]|uniref:uncharacterized protein LOC133530882 n=1 Tax=Cydia pomonella TaxID=82600 RepID=UPI002ADDB254|nr:uncharacterized protein LOC133530882 [Cydia pomonella]